MKGSIVKIFSAVVCVFAFSCVRGMNTNIVRSYREGLETLNYYGWDSPQYKETYKRIQQRDSEAAQRLAKLANQQAKAQLEWQTVYQDKKWYNRKLERKGKISNKIKDMPTDKARSLVNQQIGELQREYDQMDFDRDHCYQIYVELEALREIYQSLTEQEYRSQVREEIDKMTPEDAQCWLNTQIFEIKSKLRLDADCKKSKCSQLSMKLHVFEEFAGLLKYQINTKNIATKRP